ncbi:iron-containing alcohol dehydrogenase [Ethanoligenens harbinense]|uniref:iron-containing alcohol dehydrogenase n=1 Tax=Ethanoligenens harbinense TaxID=253239 RepID=UPI001FAA391F|nr:iron-containing alcohol dehydrogenase [Ethanoligenens harbinense]
MPINFFLPTRILMDDGCVRKHAAVFKELGKKALIVTGKHSAKANGSLQDVADTLTAQGIDYTVFDRVETNPSIANVREGAAFAKEHHVDFVIGIGGGSPMDASKAIALLACQDLADEVLFTGPYTQDILPLLLLPTTAGTGSEVTQYSILTNDRAQSKTSIANPLIFPKIAMIDAKYTPNLPCAPPSIQQSMRSPIPSRVLFPSGATRWSICLRKKAFASSPPILRTSSTTA